MTKPTPTVSTYMTPSPHSIGVEQTLARAHAVMQEHRIRHLPVLHGGKLVGLVTDRDVHFVESLKDVDPGAVTVAEAMTDAVYAVDADTPLDEVVAAMAGRKYGSAVIMQGPKIAGIFTTVDACRALAELLRSHVAA